MRKNNAYSAQEKELLHNLLDKMKKKCGPQNDV